MAPAPRFSGGGARALWLRCDLRLDDNPALHSACEGATGLLPIYVLDPARFNKATLAGAKKSSARRAQFLIESIISLRNQLRAKGSGLAIAIGRAEDILPQLCCNCNTVVVTQGVCSEETREERRVEKELGRLRVDLRREWGGTLFMPDECGCQPDAVSTLFTNFKNKAESKGRIRNPLPQPGLPPLPVSKDALLLALDFVPTLVQLGYTEEEAKHAAEHDSRGVMKFEGGEKAALRRLQKWMFADDKLKDYFTIRNGMLGDSYSSKLSPWLALGCISPRRIWMESQRYERERVKNKSTYWLTFELIWRDFFVYMGLTQGDKIFRPGGITGVRGRWKGSKDALERWKEGRTNDPLVDANMHELSATGFMSNRGRQNVASYLIFDLGVDWRFGAAHFEEHLLDHDPCSNWGNWVAAAGLTGQRVNRFNTRKQLSDYDPGGEYVDHWLRSAARAPGKPSREIAERTKSDEDDRWNARARRFAGDRIGQPDPANSRTVRCVLSDDEKKLEARAKRFGTDKDMLSSSKRQRLDTDGRTFALKA